MYAVQRADSSEAEADASAASEGGCLAGGSRWGVAVVHPVRKTAQWILSSERAPEAPHAGYDVECLACCAASDYVRDDPTPVELWAINHTTRQGMEHSQFVVRADSYWTVRPRSARESGQFGAVWGPETLLLRPVRTRGPRSHARRRPRWRALRKLREALHGVVSVSSR